MGQGIEKRSENNKPKILAISGYKNSGKTTLITRIIPLLCQRGIKVATIKHDAHDFVADVEGTDTHRHLHSGAVGTAIFCDNKYMIVNKVETDETGLFAAFSYADIILLEGFKNSNYPKLEIIRKGNSPEFDNVIAVVSEIEGEDYIHWNDLEQIVNVVCEYIKGA